MVLWHLCLFRTQDYVCHNNQLGYYQISFLDTTNIQIILADTIDRPIDRLGPVDLVLFILLMALTILNLNVKKDHEEFGNLQCCIGQ